MAEKEVPSFSVAELSVRIHQRGAEELFFCEWDQDSAQGLHPNKANQVY